MPIRVLVVEDDQDFQWLLRLSLQLEHDTTVVGVAGDGETGVDLALREQPDVVVMDLMMPRINGFEATRRIKRIRPEVKVVVVTAFPVDTRSASRCTAVEWTRFCARTTLRPRWFRRFARCNKPILRRIHFSPSCCAFSARLARARVIPDAVPNERWRDPMSRARTTAVSLIASALTSCATTPPSAPDTEKQRKVRTDLEQCKAAAGDKAYLATVTPEGKYSFQVIGLNNVNTILTCMASMGYSGTRRVHIPSSYDHLRTYIAEGEPSR